MTPHFHQQRSTRDLRPGKRARKALPFGLLLLALGMVVGASPAQARVTVAVNLDSTSQGAEAVWIARVTGVTPAGKGQFNRTPVHLLDVHVRIEEGLKGPRPPRPVVRHQRVAPNAQPMVNGYSFVELQVGETYLLFLSRDQAGRLVLWANEDHTLITLSASDLASFRRLPRRASLPERLVDLVADQLSRCQRGCMAATWLLDSSETHRRRLKAPAAKAAFINHLVRITRGATDENDLNAAYTVLGRLDHRAILPELVGRLCAPQGPNRQSPLVNSLSWLQGFPNAVQVAELRKIVRAAKDALTRAEAARRIQYLTRSGTP